jgi:hypothetical protein
MSDGFTFVFTVSPTGPEEPRRVVQQPAANDAVLEGRRDLLLAGGSREVRLAGGLADPRIGERLEAVHVIPARRDAEAIDAVLVVARVAEPLADRDVDAADRVDERDEPAEVDLRPAGDPDAQQLTDGRREHRLTTLGARELAGMPAHVRGKAVELRFEQAAIGQGHVDEVTRDRHQRDGLPDRIERRHDHRVGQGRVPADAESIPMSSTFTRCAVGAADDGGGVSSGATAARQQVEVVVVRGDGRRCRIDRRHPRLAIICLRRLEDRGRCIVRHEREIADVALRDDDDRERQDHATAVIGVLLSAAMRPTARTAISRQPRTTAWSASSPPRTAGSNRRAARTVDGVVSATAMPTSRATAIGPRTARPIAADRRRRGQARG